MIIFNSYVSHYQRVICGYHMHKYMLNIQF